MRQRLLGVIGFTWGLFMISRLQTEGVYQGDSAYAAGALLATALGVLLAIVGLYYMLRTEPGEMPRPPVPVHRTILLFTATLSTALSVLLALMYAEVVDLPYPPEVFIAGRAGVPIVLASLLITRKPFAAFPLLLFDVDLIRWVFGSVGVPGLTDHGRTVMWTSCALSAVCVGILGITLVASIRANQRVPAKQRA